MKQSHKTLLLWTLMIVMFLAIWQFFSPRDASSENIAYSDFITYAADGQIESVLIRGDEIRGVYRESKRHFATRGPTGSEALQALADGDVQVTFAETDAFWTQSLVTLLPILFIAALFIIFMRQLSGKAPSATKIREPTFTRIAPSLLFADLGGLEAAKAKLQPLVAWKSSGATPSPRPPVGYLLTGAPGTGKTQLARALAGEMGVAALEMSGAGFLDLFVGVGSARAKGLFEAARKEAPCVIILDNVDVVCPTRGADGEKGADERQSTFAALCDELDRTGADRVTVIGISSRPDRVDPGMSRSGRLGVHVDLGLPSESDRREILAKAASKARVSGDIDWAAIASRSDGLTPADLAELFVRAASPVTQAGIEAALEAMRSERVAGTKLG